MDTEIDFTKAALMKCKPKMLETVKKHELISHFNFSDEQLEQITKVALIMAARLIDLGFANYPDKKERHEFIKKSFNLIRPRGYDLTDYSNVKAFINSFFENKNLTDTARLENAKGYLLCCIKLISANSSVCAQIFDFSVGKTTGIGLVMAKQLANLNEILSQAMGNPPSQRKRFDSSERYRRKLLKERSKKRSLTESEAGIFKQPRKQNASTQTDHHDLKPNGGINGH